MDYRISCLLSIFKREFDESEKSSPSESIHIGQKAIDLESIGMQAEGIFGNRCVMVKYIIESKNRIRKTRFYHYGYYPIIFAYFHYSEACSMLDLDGHGGRTFLRVLLHLTMHDYPPLVSGALHLLFRHFSQRQEVLQAFKQVSRLHCSPLFQRMDVHNTITDYRFNFWCQTVMLSHINKLNPI